MLSLDMVTFPIREVVFGGTTHLEGDRLVINREELVRLAMEEFGVLQADVEIVVPGESARIIHACDGIEPRLKVDGPGATYPGILNSNFELAGQGRTHRLGGLAVVQSAEVPRVHNTGTGHAGEAFFDMSGPGALSPFSQTINVVICLELAPGLSQVVYERAIKQAGFKIAQRLAETTREMEPPEVTKYELGSVDPSLPKVMYVQATTTWVGSPNQLIYFYGQPLNEYLPTLVHPNELLDGALTSVSLGGRGTKATTWMQVNNPVVQELYASHGKTLNFIGTILQRAAWPTFDEKWMTTAQGAKMARLLGADGVIVTWLAAGNALTDAMLMVEACEKQGVKAVLVTYELGGQDRMEPPLIYFSPRADAVVSTGAVDIPLNLPQVRRAVGGKDVAVSPELYSGRIPADGEIKLPYLQELFASIDMWGQLNRRCLTC